tara:strand:- start:2200 stop:2535 length:336 start_codon:yes stop_codon:yes gene_type:complete
MTRKYFNKKTNGYDSRKEARRAFELNILEKAGEIINLQEQVTFELLASFKDSSGNTERGIKYIADFVYYDNKLKHLVIEDVKSAMTKKLSTYIIKRKLVKVRYPEYIFIES